MKVVILAGGFGTRLAEETDIRPKPMVEIGGYPILWHIMKHYSHFGFKEFVIALGYKGDSVKRFFLEYCTLSADMTIDLRSGGIDRHKQPDDDWVVHLIDTGLASMTGGRLKRLEHLLQGESFMVTYGDGVCNLNLAKLMQFHHHNGRVATLTAVHPPARFGGLAFDGDLAVGFSEKPQIGEGWINGGFMVFEPEIFGYLEDEHTVLESDVLPKLAAGGQLGAYRHNGFWQCMDTLREKRYLQSLWESGERPWKVWRD